MTTGARIRDERLRAGMKQRDLAKALGMSQGFLSRIERGDRPPPWGLLLAVMVHTRPDVREYLTRQGALD